MSPRIECTPPLRSVCVTRETTPTAQLPRRAVNHHSVIDAGGGGFRPHDVRMPSPPTALDLGDRRIEPRSRALVVEVRDPDDRPVEGAVVLVHLADPPFAARTDDRGRISLPRFDTTPFILEVRAEGFAPWGEVVAPDPDPGPVRVGLRPQ